MTLEKTYRCDGCGKQEPGVSQSDKEIALKDGEDAMPEGWSHMVLHDFSTMRGYRRHYCPICIKRLLDIINHPLTA